MPDSGPTRNYEEVLDDLVAKTRRNLARLDGFPHSTRGGLWRISEHGRWTAGHWVGILWLAYLHSGDESLRVAARTWAERLAPRQHDTTTHDMGFLFYPSFVRGFRITGDPWYRESAITAARSLLTRYHEPGGYIQAWDEAENPIHAGRTIVDTVMNLPLLLWAAQETGEEQFRDIALQVAKTTARHHVRPDGSTFHVVDFDPASGAAVRYTTHQGMADDSFWTRGQGWAILGFASVSQLAARDDLRDVANRLADAFVARLQPGIAPPWDFAASGPDEPRDTAAGAIAADGLLELAESGGNDASVLRLGQAQDILNTLIATSFDASDVGGQGLLLHATADRPRNSAVDESLIYGDHYFFEAVSRAATPASVAPYI